LLEMDGIDKRFPGVQALSNARFSLRSGEVHALVGENGAGKSTLMKILTGIHQKDKGRICYNNHEIEIPNPKSAQKYGISMVHQELNLMPDLTVAQNIFIGREPCFALGMWLNEPEINTKAKQLFKELNLDLDPRMLVSDLTIAKQQMVEIAKALSFDAKILIMDEPTAALTETETETLFRIVENLRDIGVGIVYISHRMEELKRISNRITVLRDGYYIGTLDTPDTTIDQIIGMMVGRNVYWSARPDLEIVKKEKVLSIKNLNRYKTLKDINFDLHKGEILGFSGLMGAGRTELARAIFGADPIDSGEIHVNGKRAKINKPADAVRQGICYLSEDRKRFGLMLDMDVKNNMVIPSLKEFSSALGFVNESKTNNISQSMVEALSIKTPGINQEVKLLSGGNQQKVVIAKWLIRNCEIIIFDEPTRGIDVGAKGEIYKLLQKLAEEGKSIIFISSELPEILRISHRIIVMCEGRITAQIKNESITQETIMRYATNFS